MIEHTQSKEDTKNELERVLLSMHLLNNKRVKNSKIFKNGGEENE